MAEFQYKTNKQAANIFKRTNTFSDGKGIWLKVSFNSRTKRIKKPKADYRELVTLLKKRFRDLASILNDDFPMEMTMFYVDDSNKVFIKNS